MNLKGIGASAKIYADEHDGQWMTPPFKAGNIDTNGIDYVNDTRWINVPPSDPGEVGFDREFASTSETPSTPAAGSRALSTTRAFWMLVRSGDVNLKQFVCPSSADTVDQTEDAELYYDFASYEHISYGYQVPFGPPETRPGEGAHIGRVHVADKGPFYLVQDDVSWEVDLSPLRVESTPGAWRKLNSPNHGGPREGEGQNCLYADGTVRFQRTPVVGVDNDNIYTLMLDEWDHEWGRIHGQLPQRYPVPPYPGQEAFGSGAGNYASTDSLIYP
jgi:hypothetical protein